MQKYQIEDTHGGRVVYTGESPGSKGGALITIRGSLEFAEEIPALTPGR